MNARPILTRPYCESIMDKIRLQYTEIIANIYKR